MSNKKNFGFDQFLGAPVVMELNSDTTLQVATLLGFSSQGVWLSAKGFEKHYGKRQDQTPYTMRFFPWSDVKYIDFESHLIPKPVASSGDEVQASNAPAA